MSKENTHQIQTRVAGKDKAYLGSTSDHVLDDITLTLGLQFVQHPGVLEGALAGLLGLLLELLDGPLVNTTALVDQVTSGGRLAGVNVADDNNVDMSLFLQV